MPRGRPYKRYYILQLRTLNPVQFLFEGVITLTRMGKLHIALCILFLAPTAFSQARTEPTAREVAGRTLPSVVLLVFETGRPNGGKLGSGFFVGQDIIATNFHVVDGARSGYVKLPGSQAKYEVLGLVAVDSPRDLALVKIKGMKGKPLPLGDSRTVGVGDDVYAVGNPEGLEGTFSTGMVSSVRKRADESLIQITAPISAGSSGGPVLNSSGEVIGVAMGKMTGGEALNFAIPSAYLKSLLANQKSVQPLESNERPSDITEVLQPQPTATGSALPLSERRIPHKTAAPSLDTTDVAMERANDSWKEGAVTEIHFFSEAMNSKGKPQLDVRYDGDECSFKIATYHKQGTGRALVGQVDYMDLRANCGNGWFNVIVSTDRIGLNLSPGTYDHARNPLLENVKAPGFGFSGAAYLCQNPTDVSFEILGIHFDTSHNHNELTSLGLEFRQECGSGLGTMKGTIYLNYAK